MGGKDGYQPWAGLADVKGTLFGTTLDGGLACCGTAFELAPAAPGGFTKSTIYSFEGGFDGAFPMHPSSRIRAGRSTARPRMAEIPSCPTVNAPAPGCGTVFKLTPGGTGFTESILHSFAGETWLHAVHRTSGIQRPHLRHNDPWRQHGYVRRGRWVRDRVQPIAVRDWLSDSSRFQIR